MQTRFKNLYENERQIEVSPDVHVGALTIITMFSNDISVKLL